MAWIFETDGDYVNFNGGGNLWRLHKDSNCIAWHWDESGDLFFDVYDQQYVVKAENIGQVVVGGVTLTEAADFATEIVNVFTGLSSGGGASYLVYVALLTQTGTSAPVATVLENTLGGTPVLNYQDVGSFYAILSNAFPSGKTVCFIQQSNYFSTAQYNIYRDDNNTVFISSEGWGGADWEAANGIMLEIAIEIRVYP